MTGNFSGTHVVPIEGSVPIEFVNVTIDHDSAVEVLCSSCELPSLLLHAAVLRERSTFTLKMMNLTEETSPQNIIEFCDVSLSPGASLAVEALSGIYGSSFFFRNITGVESSMIALTLGENARDLDVVVCNVTGGTSVFS
jgi:hypothetical protein